VAAVLEDGIVSGTHSGTFSGAGVSGDLEGTSVSETFLPDTGEVSLFLDQGALISPTEPSGVPLGIQLSFSNGAFTAVDGFTGRMLPTTFDTNTPVIELVGPMGDRTYGLAVPNEVDQAKNPTGSVGLDNLNLAVEVEFKNLPGRMFIYQLTGQVIGNAVVGTYEILEGAALISSGRSFKGHLGDGLTEASRTLPILELLPAAPSRPGVGFTPPYFGSLSAAAIRERAWAGALWLTEAPEVASFGVPAVTDIEETNNKRYDNAAYNAYGAAVAFGILGEIAEDPLLRLHARQASENAGYWLDIMGRGNYRGIATYYKQMFHVSVWGAFAHMDLYETTGDTRWLEAVKGYFNVLRDEVTRRMDGPEVRDFAPDDGVPAGRTWTYLNEDTGEVGESSGRNDRSRDNFELNPGTFLWLLGKLRSEHGINDFVSFENGAAQWVADNIGDAEIWDGGSGVPPADGATFYAMYLLDYADTFDPSLLDGVIHYIETELTDWSHPLSEDGLSDTFAPHVKNNVSRWASGYYPTFVGGTAATSRMALVYLKRYGVSADSSDVEKAQALVQSVLRSQKPESGMIHHLGIREFSEDHEIRLLRGPNGAEIDPLFNPGGRRDQHPYSGMKANVLRNLLSYAEELENLGLDCDQPQEIAAPSVIQKDPIPATFELAATATSGLPVSFEVIEGPASLIGSSLSLSGSPGIVKILLTQEGDSVWCAATPVVTYVSVGENTPARPESLTAIAGSSESVALNWTDDASNELRYRIERRIPGDPDWQTLTLLPQNTSQFTDDTPSPDTTYEYRVVAENEVAESAPSPMAQVTTPGDEVYIYLDIECGNVGPGYEVRENPEAGGGADVITVIDQSSREDIDPLTIIDYEFFVPRSGTYHIWLRGRAIKGGASDSVWLMVDDGAYVVPDTFYTHSVCTTGYCWRPNNDTFPFDAGMHKITIAVREKDAVLDRFLITTDSSNFAGFGEGGPAANCGSDGEGPAVSIEWNPEQEDAAISFFAKQGFFYQLESSNTLQPGDWEPSGPPVEGNDEILTLRRLSNSSSEFFRVVEQ
jgi:hypothetical protein